MNNKKIRAVGALLLVALWLVLTGFAWFAPPKEMSESEIAGMIKFNSLVKEFAENTPNCFYVDTFNYEPLSRPEIFHKDGTHYIQSGYDVYTEFYREVLKDELEKF